MGAVVDEQAEDGGRAIPDPCQGVGHEGRFFQERILDDGEGGAQGGGVAVRGHEPARRAGGAVGEQEDGLGRRGGTDAGGQQGGEIGVDTDGRVGDEVGSAPDCAGGAWR